MFNDADIKKSWKGKPKKQENFEKALYIYKQNEFLGKRYMDYTVQINRSQKLLELKEKFNEILSISDDIYTSLKLT